MAAIGAETLRQAFEMCYEMDASLAERLDAFARSLRRFDAPSAEAVDRLIVRLERADVGAGAPQVGEPMPPFQLPSESGRLVSLAELLPSGPVAVVIHRGHWCPYCRINTHTLAEAGPRIRQAGGQVVAITPESQRYAKAIHAEAMANFPVLTDLDNGYALSLNLVFWIGGELMSLMSRDGIDLARYQASEAWMLPVPATFVVGQDGRVRARFVDPDYRQRMPIDELIAALRSA